jgi:hypothetical protein
MLKIYTVTFDFGEATTYKVLNEVFIHSVEKNCPNAEWRYDELDEPELNGIIKGFVTNTVKLDLWVKELEKCEEGDELVLIDCDMLVLGDISPVFKKDFDVAYTFRTQSKWPMNGGTMFVKVNDRSRAFFYKFLEINNTMLKDKVLHQKYRDVYAGMNQAAFGYILEHHKDIAKLKALPCAIWNVCEHYDQAIKNGAKILHIKGKLRQNIFRDRVEDDELKTATLLWKQYYEEYKKNGIGSTTTNS